jgi:DNA-binding NarL/FixJ family response regulator
MLKLLIVDDHTALTAGLAALIQQKWNAAEIHFAQTSDDALRIARGGTHLVLINPRMNGIDPFGIATEIKRISEKRIRVAFLMDKPCIATARRIRDAKLDGIVLASDPTEAFCYALQVVMSGHVSIPPVIADKFFQSEKEDSSLANLTPREITTLTLKAQGMSMKEIAHTMGVSVKTAETHRNNLGRKLGHPSSAQLIAFSLMHGLVSGEQLEIAA